MKSKHLFRILIATCCILFLLPEDVMAQRRNRRIQFLNRLEHDHRPYHFGFALGVNTMNFSIKPDDDLQGEYGFEYVLPEQDYGFHIGIVSSLKLGQFTDLRFIPTISFGERYLEYYRPGEWDPHDPDPGGRQYLEATILEFPLHLKYKSARMTNTRVYVLTGAKYTHDLASIELGIGENILARVGRNDIHYEVGAGFDQYFYYFKFSAEIKLSFGLTNLVRPGEVAPINDYYNSIDRLNSRSLMVSLTFE